MSQELDCGENTSIVKYVLNSVICSAISQSEFLFNVAHNAYTKHKERGFYVVYFGTLERAFESKEKHFIWQQPCHTSCDLTQKTLESYNPETHFVLVVRLVIDSEKEITHVFMVDKIAQKTNSVPPTTRGFENAPSLADLLLEENHAIGCQVCKNPKASVKCNICVVVYYCSLKCKKEDKKLHKKNCKIFVNMKKNGNKN